MIGDGSWIMPRRASAIVFCALMSLCIADAPFVPGPSLWGQSSTGGQSSSSSADSTLPATPEPPRGFGEGTAIIRAYSLYDLRRKVNDRNVGLRYGSVLSIFERTQTASALGASAGGMLRGTWKLDAMIARETDFDQSKAAKALTNTPRATLSFAPNGAMLAVQGELPNIPAWLPLVPPELSLKPGVRWTVQSVLRLDPRGNGSTITLPVLIEYKVEGSSAWQGRPALLVTGQYAIRMPLRGGVPQHPEVKNLFGTRKSQVYLDAQTLSPMFIREQVIGEKVTYSDNSSVTNDGFVLTFFEGYLPPGEREDRRELLEELIDRTDGSDQQNNQQDNQQDNQQNNQIREDQIEDVQVREGELGIVLTIENLRFVADKAQLLPGDEVRLDEIAQALKRISSSLLVRGHTAAVGTELSQLELSQQRAKAIIDALVARGVAAERFAWVGLGGREPIAPNDTEANRAKNRRVEIVILRD